MSAVALLLAVAMASAPPSPPCDAACERKAAEELLGRGEVRAAVERLRRAVGLHPDDPLLPLLLARGYLLDGNLFWAERALRATLERRPDDATARDWLACVHLREGDPDLAREDLGSAAPSPEGPERSRRALLRAFRATVLSDPAAARTELAGLGRAAPVFPEDRTAWEALARQSDPWWIEPVSGELELGAGYTTNALAGAPTDPGASGTGSWLGDVTVRTRLAPPLLASFRPFLDVEGVGHGLEEEAYRELSSLQGSLRAGGLVSLGRYRALLAYRAEELHLRQTPSLYSVARRGELEVESRSGWLLFGGGGHRTYRDPRRSRREWDVGLGGPVRLAPRTPAVVGATVRGAAAASPAYDLLGVSLATALRIGLPGGFTARLAVTAALDDYPHSGGRDGLLAFGTTERRRDLLGKVALGLWLPPWRALRIALEGQLARRDSTADQMPGSDYDYTEARARLLVRFTFGADPWAPHVVRPAGHVPLEWGLAPGTPGESERIIDLLRQDEELRRGSSCGL